MNKISTSGKGKNKQTNEKQNKQKEFTGLQGQVPSQIEPNFVKNIAGFPLLVSLYLKWSVSFGLSRADPGIFNGGGGGCKCSLLKKKSNGAWVPTPLLIQVYLCDFLLVCHNITCVSFYMALVWLFSLVWLFVSFFTCVNFFTHTWTPMEHGVFQIWPSPPVWLFSIFHQ